MSVAYHYQVTVTDATTVEIDQDTRGDIDIARTHEFHLAGAGTVTVSVKTGSADTFVELFTGEGSTVKAVDLGGVTAFEVVAAGGDVDVNLFGFKD